MILIFYLSFMSIKKTKKWRDKMNRELVSFGDVDLEEREKFEERYREEQKVLKKLRRKKRFRKRQYKKETLKNLKDMIKKMTYIPDKKE